VEGTNPTLIANATYENTPANLNVTTSFETYTVSAAVDTASTTNIILFIWSDVTDTTAGDFLYVTNVQLEKGSTATSFDYRPYGTEEALCQRYFQKSYNASVAPATSSLVGFLVYTAWADSAGFFYGTIPAKQTMRAAPTMTFYNTGGTINKWLDTGAVDRNISAFNVGDSFFTFQFGTITVGSTGQAYGHFVASAEL
jgi:hypothetical protein